MNTNITPQTEASIKPAKPERRYDIDWLRVLAVLVLFPFHTARIFDIWEPFYAKNEQTSVALSYFLAVVHVWHMPLFFLLAGASTWFALRFRSGKQYTGERIKRLLLPLIFGVLVIVAPQSYLGALTYGNFTGSFFEYYPHFFQISLAGLDGYMGGFTPGHLWFILFLFVLSLIALPFFLLLNREFGQRLTRGLAVFCTWPGMIFLLAIPLYVANRLVDFYPDPLYFLAYFMLGFILISDGRFSEAIGRHKTVALILGPVLWIFIAYFSVTGWPEFMPQWFGPFLNVYADGFAPWFFMVALLGYGQQFLNFTNRFLKYFAEASYPVYILHQTVIVVIGFYVVQWSAGVSVKYVTILVASFVATVILYDLLVRRTNVTRFLFGMRPLKKKSPGII
jgi:peptidoglycan/LPS O-acetylase OafA/YrhL